MEHVFGTIQRDERETEILKTIGTEHTNYSGRTTVHREYPDRTIDDVFTVVEKYDSKEDSEGRCYDWYEITAHYRDTDRFSPRRDEIDSKIDYIAMMADIDIPDGTEERNGEE